MSGRRSLKTGLGMVNEFPDVWSMPWHARLKNLADGLRIESQPAGTACHPQRTATVAGPAASWLGRAHGLAAPSRMAGAMRVTSVGHLAPE